MSSLNYSNDQSYFESALIYLGGLATTPNLVKISFVDLEEFFLIGTNFCYVDARLTRTFEYWVAKYGKLLSPKRLCKLIEKGDLAIDFQCLGPLLSIIDHKFPRGKFASLEAYCKIGELKKMFPFLLKSMRRDERWEKYGVIAPVFQSVEESHFLRNEKYVCDHCPEIRFRIMGVSPMRSNLLAYRAKFPKLSLYRVAKDLDLTYAFAHRSS